MNNLLIGEGSFEPEMTFALPGYKHASNVVLCATLALPQQVRITNAPDISDTQVLCKILAQLGAQVSFKQGNLLINSSSTSGWKVPADLSTQSHAAIYLLPVLLGKLGKVQLGQTGGCKIGKRSKSGERPIQHMIKVLEQFGGTFTLVDGILEGNADKFSACEIDIFDFSDRADVLTGPLISGATKTAILAALFVEQGTSIIRNPYRKPDVTELLAFAHSAGYAINDEGHTISISAPKKDITVPPFELIDDISVLVTYLTLAIYHNSALSLYLKSPEKVKKGLQEELILFDKMGIQLQWKEHGLFIPANQKIKAIDIEVTSVGIYSDHQPFFALMLSKASQSSTIKEFVWEHRFDYALELNKLADKTVFNLIDSRTMQVLPGVMNRHGQELIATDLRAAAVTLIAVLQLKGNTVIKNVGHLERGYEHLKS